MGIRSPLHWALFCSVLAITFQTTALWMAPDDTVPIERLLSNLQKQLDQAPESHALLTQIARVHSRAYALEKQDVDVRFARPVPPGQEQPKDAPLQLYEMGATGFWSPRGGIRNIADDQVEHLKQAIAFYRKATAQKEATSYDWLGLGFTLHEASRIPERVAEPGGLGKGDAELAAESRRLEDQALEAYWKCFELNADGENREHFDNRSKLQIESGGGIVEIMSRRTDLDNEGQRRFKVARRRVAELNATYRPMITPIILHLSEQRTLEQLLAPEVHVTFDLDGSGQGDTWPWVQPDTAFLVWDEDGRGDVPSGRVLFGSVTWWIFWNHGYEALASLDDDRDGWLLGQELHGLAVWQDANSNGVADSGEVRSLAQTGVEALAVEATATVSGMPANLAGARLRGGTLLPTYDWITAPVKGASP